MPNGTCSVDGCERNAYCRGWCATHYHRWQVEGDPGPAEIPHYKYRRPTCSVDGCEGQHEARGWCRTHYLRWKRTGDPLYVTPPQKGAAHAQWKGSDIDYLGAHNRVRRAKGKASQFSCVKCGGKARDWAYDHGDPDELVGMTGPQAGMPYSLDLERYQPMCKPCHNTFDRLHAGSADY